MTRSWYQREPSCSLQLIAKTAPAPSAAIIDVGSGTSLLVDRLLDRGFTDVTLLDVSGQALDEVRRRLGGHARSVSFIREDVLSWKPARRYDLWHDRAVLHFLTDESQRACYVSVAEAALPPGGELIVATFAEDGPTQCSGLPVRRYSAAELAETFAAGFEPVASEREAHYTPAGAVQHFTWLLLRRR